MTLLLWSETALACMGRPSFGILEMLAYPMIPALLVFALIRFKFKMVGGKASFVISAVYLSGLVILALFEFTLGDIIAC